MLNFQTVNMNQNPSNGAHIQSMCSLPIQYSYRRMHSLHIQTCVAPFIHPSKCTCSFAWLWALYHWLWSISRNNNQGKIHSRVGVRVTIRSTFSVSHGSRFRRKRTAISQSFFVQVKREEIRLTPTHLRGEHSGSPGLNSFGWWWWWWCSWKWKWKEMCFQAIAKWLRWCNRLGPGMMKVKLLFYEEAQFPGCTRWLLCVKLNLIDGLQGVEMNGKIVWFCLSNLFFLINIVNWQLRSSWVWQVFRK